MSKANHLTFSLPTFHRMSLKLLTLVFATIWTTGCLTGEIGDSEYVGDEECIVATNEDVNAIVISDQAEENFAPLCQSDEPTALFSYQIQASGTGCGVCPAGTQSITATNRSGQTHTQTFCNIPSGLKGSVLYFGQYFSTVSNYNYWTGSQIGGALCRNSYGSNVTWAIFQ